MNHAQVFAARFPNATDRTGWTTANFTLLLRDIGHRVTPTEFEQVCQSLLRSRRRESFPVPCYGEVIAEVDRFCAARSAPTVDPAIQRLRAQQAAYTPPTPEQKAARRRWLDAFKADDKAGMAEADREMRRIDRHGRGGAA